MEDILSQSNCSTSKGGTGNEQTAFLAALPIIKIKADSIRIG